MGAIWNAAGAGRWPGGGGRLGWVGVAPVGVGAIALCLGVWPTTLTSAQETGEATTSQPPIEQLAVGLVGDSAEESFETTLAGLLPEWETDQ